MDPEKKYPIAEIFTSVQGEGRWTGYPTTFVRLAGCNVGRYESPEKLPKDLATLRVLHPRHPICTTQSGHQFLCDTDYFVREELTAREILSQVKAPHVCLTGGEPLLHDLEPLLQVLLTPSIERIQIETSGTKPIPVGLPRSVVLWITCSPKQGCKASVVEQVDEIKVLVPDAPSAKETLRWLTSVFGLTSLPKLSRPEVYLQPINGLHDVWRPSLQACGELLQDPLARALGARVSLQIHKLLNVR